MNKLLATICTIAVAVTGNARTVTDFFASPDANSVFTLLPKNTRLDMADYYTSGMPHTSTNAMGGSSRMTNMSTESISFDLTSDIQCQLAMLTSQRDTVLMLIETQHLPQADSHITFYDKNWQPLKNAPLETPKLATWLTAAGKANESDVEKWLPFLLWEAKYENKTLVLTNTLNSYYADPVDTKNLQEWLLPSITYIYNGKKFSQKK
jgi:hypothetical protein